MSGARYCPVCDATVDGDEVCPRDGARLLTVRDALAEEAERLRGQTIDGRYRIDALIGAGGMGCLYAATQVAVERKVALKLLPAHLGADTDAVRRFAQEARTASAITHPNVVTLHDFGQGPEGRLYLVMELVEGPTLDAVLKRAGPLPPARTLEIALQLLDAVGAAHARGVIHRDLKPANLMLSPQRGRSDLVKVLDFGLARMTGEGGTTITRSGQVFGTPQYMAPEQARGDRCDHRADLYAVGVILYEMLSGRRPFDSDSVSRILVQQIQQAPPPLEAPAPLAAVVARALAKDPSERYASAAEMAAALIDAGESAAVAGALAAASPMARVTDREAVLAETVSVAVGSDVAAIPAPPAGQRRRRAAWAAVAVLVGGAGLWLASASSDAPGAAADAGVARPPATLAPVTPGQPPTVKVAPAIETAPTGPDAATRPPPPSAAEPPGRAPNDGAAPARVDDEAHAPAARPAHAPPRRRRAAEGTPGGSIAEAHRADAGQRPLPPDDLK